MLRSVFAIALILTPGAAHAGPAEESCLRDIAALRQSAAKMPADDLSRRFAERELDTALTEMNAGEVEDCPAALAHVRHVIVSQPYRLLPGETIDIRP